MKIWKYVTLWLLGVPAGVLIFIGLFTDWLK